MKEVFIKGKPGKLQLSFLILSHLLSAFLFRVLYSIFDQGVFVFRIFHQIVARFISLCIVLYHYVPFLLNKIKRVNFFLAVNSWLLLFFFHCGFLINFGSLPQ